LKEKYVCEKKKINVKILQNKLIILM